MYMNGSCAAALADCGYPDQYVVNLASVSLSRMYTCAVKNVDDLNDTDAITIAIARGDAGKSNREWSFQTIIVRVTAAAVEGAPCSTAAQHIVAPSCHEDAALRLLAT